MYTLQVYLVGSILVSEMLAKKGALLHVRAQLNDARLYSNLLCGKRQRH